MVEPGDKNPPGGAPELVCPKTHLPLESASGELLERLRGLQERGELTTIDGQALDSPLSGAWVRIDGALLYPVIDGIARMVIEDAIALEGEGPAAGE